MSAKPQVVTMYDTVHAAAMHIPAGAAKIGGYVTGTPDIQWTAADWARLPHAGHVRIDQSAAGLAYASVKADVYDVETGAGTPTQFAALASKRQGLNEGNSVYASRLNLAAAAAALDRIDRPAGWWHGMPAWLADPNLNLSEATALVGTVLEGFTLAAVQWAWPTTNPNTEVEGGTLKTLNLDLSVALDSWFPATSAPPPPPTWQAEALTEAEGAQVHLTRLTALLKAHQ
jgi:hypothetical protein